MLMSMITNIRKKHLNYSHSRVAVVRLAADLYIRFLCEQLAQRTANKILIICDKNTHLPTRGIT